MTKNFSKDDVDWFFSAPSSEAQKIMDEAKRRLLSSDPEAIEAFQKLLSDMQSDQDIVAQYLIDQERQDLVHLLEDDEMNMIWVAIFIDHRKPLNQRLQEVERILTDEAKARKSRQEKDKKVQSLLLAIQRSQYRQAILLKVLELESSKNSPFKWEPKKWFSTSNRHSSSWKKDLNELEQNQLIVIHSSSNASTIELTPLGRELAKHLQSSQQNTKQTLQNTKQAQLIY